MLLRVTITRSGLAAIGKTGFRNAGRHAIEAVGLYWRQKYLPLHFMPIAYRRYGFRPRTAATNRKKKLRLPFLEGVGDQTPAIGEVKPNVFTGRSRAALLADPTNVKATATSFERYRCEVPLDAPAFNFTAGRPIDSGEEVRRVNAQELVTLDNLFGSEWNADLVRQGLTAPKQTYRSAG